MLHLFLSSAFEKCVVKLIAGFERVRPNFAQLNFSLGLTQRDPAYLTYRFDESSLP